MKRILLLLSFVTLSSFAQEKKYQSLFWEISGNGLLKKSYMYGTMHVSEKVSYHLSDAFFEKLMAADVVANESEPNTWTELYDLFSFYQGIYQYGPFYSRFYAQPIKKENLYPLFKSTNYNLISLLSRTNDANQEFQEDTYLDMFIYRTGKKYGKKTVGLEDVKKTTFNIMKAEAEMDVKEVEKNKQLLLKLLKKRAYTEVITSAYREKDLDLIDTLNSLTSPKSYLRAMLYDRNKIMVKSMDSIMKSGSLFSAVGAAHLPGKNGIIELLRSKGYTVKPIISEYTEKGKKLKKQIEDYFVKPNLQVKSSADGMISLPLFPLVLENGENLESPDLANGGFINVKRLLLKDYVAKKDQFFNPKTLDSLFFENIPGDILEKKVYNEKNYLVYDIKSKTKTSKAQHYRYYVTPLEIIAIIMGGEGDYVRQFEEEIYTNIKLKSYRQDWETIEPFKGGFQVKVPSYNVVTGNKKQNKQLTDVEIYAYDEQEKATYFVIEKSLLDNANLEDSEFELKRMHYEYYNQHNLDSTQTHFDVNKYEFVSAAKIDDQEIYLKSLLKGNKYYLLGVRNATKPKMKHFFDSFSFKSYMNDVVYKTYRDEKAFFKVEVPRKENEYLDFKFEQKDRFSDEDKKKNYFDSKNKTYEFFSPNKNVVELSYFGSHRYESFKAIDSLYANLRKNLATDFESEKYDELVGDVSEVEVVAIDEVAGTSNYSAPKIIEETKDKENKFDPTDYASSTWEKTLGLVSKEKLELINEKIASDADKDYYVYEVLATKPKSTQAIKYKVVLKKGETYMLKTLVDKNYKNEDPFIEKVFTSFKVDDEVPSRTVFENKLSLFEEDLKSEHDSIRISAIKSFDRLSIEKEDFSKLKVILENFDFKSDEQELVGNIYEKIGAIQSPEIIYFLEKAYKKETTTTQIQFAILRALTYQKSKEAYKKIGELLDYDLPISDNQYEISSLFNLFINDLENAHILYPQVLEYYSIKEYHEPVVSFVKTLMESEKVHAKKIKSYKKMLITNAKLEYKRLVSWNSKQATSDENDYDYEDEAPISDLDNYLSILYAFKKDKEVGHLFQKAKDLKISELNVALVNKELAKNRRIDKTELSLLINDPKTKYIAFQMLYHNKQFDLLDKYPQDTIVKAAIDYYEDIKPKKDSIVLLGKRELEFKDKKVCYFFYKNINIEEDSYNSKSETISGIAFVKEKDRLNLKAFSKLESKRFLEDKEIEENSKMLIDKSLNSNHLRVNFVKKQGNGAINDESEYYEED